ADSGSEISDLDAVEGNFSRTDQRDVAIRGQILQETSRRKSGLAPARDVEPGVRARDACGRVHDHDAARAAALSSSNADGRGEAAADPLRAGTGTPLFEGANPGGLPESRALRPEHRRRGRGQ